MKTQKQDLGKVSLTCNGTWDAGKQYDRLCIVNDGNFASYISKKDVPIGTVLSDERFWQPIANLRDDIKIDYETFKKEWLELLASIQIKLRSARVVVANEEARNNLTWLEVAAGCEVYELDTQLTYILDSIVPVINLKSWHLVVGSLLDSEAKFQLDGTYELTAERAIADRWGYIIDEVYVSKKEVKNLVLSIVNDKLENMSITIPPNSITPEDLSQAVLDLIGSGGNVVNNPDEEDITSESLSNGTSVLKFKDRDYVEGTFNGLGEVILRKNQVGIINLLEQANINKPNTVYVVRYDFCLGGATITLPKNSTLKFEGGSIDNGTIVGNNSCIISDIDKTILGKDLVIEGTWNIEHIYDKWFAFDSSADFLSNQIITNILALSNDNVYNTIHFDADRTYYFENTYKGKTNLGDDVRPNYWLLNTPDYDFLRIFTGFTSNTHLIVNNTIQMLPTNQGAYFIFHIENKENITISGTGAINGDAKDHLYTDPFAGTNYYGEWGHVLNFRSCNNVVVRDITIGYAFGDGIALGNAAYNNNGVKEAGLATKNVTIDAVKVLYARRNGISLGGNNYTITNVYFEGNGSDTIKGTAPMAAIDFENDYVDIEPSGLCTNVSMNNCKFKDNKYDVSSTIRDDLYEVPRGELVNISDCNFTSPLRLNRTNGLTFSNCHIVGITNVDNSIAAWYSSKDLIFSNCIFDELNPYLTISAEEQNKKFINPTYPEDIRYSTTFQHNLPVGKALKFTIPKPLVGEVEFTAFCSNPNYSNIQMPVNTTIYTFGPSQRLTGIRDIKIKASQDSTPRYSMYKNTPVFSYINYTEDSNNFIIYFAIGGNLIGDSYASATSVNIFLTSKTKFITVEAPVSGRPDYAGMYGGKWSELSAIIKESVDISSIPSTVTFPSKEMYSGNMLADLPTSLTADKVGFSQFVLDGTYKRPVFWDSYSNVFRTADGNKALERRVTSLAELDVLTAKLTVDDRGYVVYYTVTTSYLTWRGTDWTNEDGSLFSKVKYIKQTNTIDILNIMFSYSGVIYKICADIDLGGGTLTVATGSTLDFQGGSFSNGTIVGQNTKVEAGLTKIFGTDIILSGTWIADSLSPEYFGTTGVDATQDTTYIQKALDCCAAINIKTVKLQNKTYQINSSLLIQSNIKLEGAATRVWNNGSATILSLAENIIGINVESTGVEINDLKITGNTTNTGISFTNRSYYFSGNRIVTTGLGIGFDIQSSWTYIFNLCRIEGGTIGFKIQEGTSGTFNSCVAFSCTEYGFYVTKLNYGSFNGCGTDGCKYGFYFTDACRGVTLSSCGCENTQVGGYMVKCGARAYVTITAFSVGTMADVDCDLFIFEADCRVSLIDLNVGSLYHPTGNTLNVASGAAVALINCYLTGNNVGLENCSVISPYGNTLKYSTTVDKINTKELVTSSLATNATYTILPTAPLNSVYLITAVTNGNSAARGLAIVTIPTDYGMANVDNLVANANCQISIDATGNIIVTNTSTSAKAYRVSLLKLV